MIARDYRKFLNADGNLNLRLLRPHVQTELLTAFRRDPTVIHEVFDELWFSWDLRQRQEQVGVDADIVALAEEIISEMEEDDYLRVRVAFERRLIERFAEDPARFSTILDPVYDELEENGWTPYR